MACIKNCLQLRANVEYLHTQTKKKVIDKNEGKHHILTFECYVINFFWACQQKLYVPDVAITALHDAMTFVDRKINIVTENTKNDGKGTK